MRLKIIAQAPGYRRLFFNDETKNLFVVSASTSLPVESLEAAAHFALHCDRRAGGSYTRGLHEDLDRTAEALAKERRDAWISKKSAREFVKTVRNIKPGKVPTEVVLLDMLDIAVVAIEQWLNEEDR